MEQTNTQLPGVLSLIQTTLKRYRDYFAELATIALPLVIIYAISQILSNAHIFLGKKGGLVFAIEAAAVLFALLWVIGTVIFQGALYLKIKALYQGAILEVEGAYRQAAKLFWSIVFLAIIQTFFVLFSSFAFFIPGIILSIFFMFAVPILFFEGKKGMEALIASMFLVKGRWMPVFGRLIGVALIALIACLILVLIIGQLFKAFPFVLETLQVLFMFFVITPLSYLFTVELMNALKSTNPVEVTDLDRASAKRNIWMVTGIGFVCLIAVCVAIFYGFSNL